MFDQLSLLTGNLSVYHVLCISVEKKLGSIVGDCFGLCQVWSTLFSSFVASNYDPHFLLVDSSKVIPWLNSLVINAQADLGKLTLCVGKLFGQIIFVISTVQLCSLQKSFP